MKRYSFEKEVVILGLKKFYKIDPRVNLIKSFWKKITHAFL